MLKKTLIATVLLTCASALAQENPVWKTIQPGGDTICSDGTPYSYLEMKANPRKLVLEFMGGGACWNDLTCGAGSKTYIPNLTGASSAQLSGGIYDKSNATNPVKDWSHVFVPYCTADVHLGNNVKTYQGKTVYHKGAVNARAVLNDVFQKYPELDQILVTGCSAGSYGSIMATPYMLRQYPNARVVQLGDAGLGVAPASFGQVGFANWNASGAIPDWMESLAAVRNDVSQLTVAGLYNAIGTSYPKALLSQVTSSTDTTQIGFYSLMKGIVQPDQKVAVEWMTGALTQLKTLAATTPNFSAYVYGGQDHCVINRAGFYTTTVGGVKLTDWLNTALNGQKPAPVLP